METGRTKCFASALDWPGWARAARDPDAALAALETYRSRYAAVLGAGGLDVPTGGLFVAASEPGDATTDFGAPSVICELDRRALRSTTRSSLAAFVSACWTRFDAVAARTGELRAGPRGGGRSVAKMVAHVHGADVAYARALGLRVDALGDDDLDAVRALRSRVLAVLQGHAEADREGRWPHRYAARRIAWHACDHLFELEDRAIG